MNDMAKEDDKLRETEHKNRPNAYVKLKLSDMTVADMDRAIEMQREHCDCCDRHDMCNQCDVYYTRIQLDEELERRAR